MEKYIKPEDVLSSPFTWQDIDFREGDIGYDNCERLYVIIKGVEIPVETINLQAQMTRLNKIQLHIFIDQKYHNMGIATKIYIAFIHLYGGIYSGYGRVLNRNAIDKIYSKLNNEPDIQVSQVYVQGNDNPIGIEAKLINN